MDKNKSIFETISNFILEYKIINTKIDNEYNGINNLIYDSIVEIIMRNMNTNNYGVDIIHIINMNIEKIKENIAIIKIFFDSGTEININYTFIDLLIFKSLIFIYNQVNYIPNISNTFIEDVIKLRNIQLIDRDDYSYFYKPKVSKEDESKDKILKLYLFLKLNSQYINFNNYSEWKTVSGFEHSTGIIKSTYHFDDKKYGNVYNSLTGCAENTISALYKGDVQYQSMRNKMQSLHNYNVKIQIEPNVESIKDKTKGYGNWWPKINDPEEVKFIPWYIPSTYFMSLLSTSINSDGLLFSSKKILINSLEELKDFFLKIAKIYYSYIVNAKEKYKEKYNGFSMPFAILKNNYPTHYIIFSCDKYDNFYYIDTQNEAIVYLFNLVIANSQVIDIDTKPNENPLNFEWFSRKMNFSDRHKNEFNKNEANKDILNKNYNKGIIGFEVFFWVDTYTDNLDNDTNEKKFNYISKIANNILIIKPNKPFAKYDYPNYLTFGGNRMKIKYLKYKNKYLQLKNKLNI
jgi:hypothetical protein